MDRINLSLGKKDRELLRRLAGDRSEAEYSRELLLRSLRQDEIRAMNEALLKMAPETKERLQLIGAALEELAK